MEQLGDQPAAKLTLHVAKAMDIWGAMFWVVEEKVEVKVLIDSAIKGIW